MKGLTPKEVIEKEMKTRNVSENELAFIAGVSINTIAKISDGSDRLNMRTLTDVLEKLGYDVVVLARPAAKTANV